MAAPSAPLRAGFATAEGTRRYAARFANRSSTPLRASAAEGHFHEQPGTGELVLSSIGIGTYLGNSDPETDRGYTDAVVAAVTNGVNVIDSAINYRFQRSERSIGAALKKLAELGHGREELILCTKGGYLTPDGEMPADPSQYFFREYIEPGIFRVDEIVGGHCMTPRYLSSQLERSLCNLGVECIDVYYLHNPESQLGAVPREEFSRRVRAAFEYLESAVAACKIRAYGLATWNAFRQPETAPDYISLAEMEILAQEVGGPSHHFRFVQLPFNLGMTEALTRPNQALDNRLLPMIEAAHALGITLIASASLLQGQVARNLPPFIAEALGLESDLHRALQFARSAPGITTALVGMSRVEHVEMNLKLVAVPPASPEQFSKLFERQESA
jgi:aryl-alcohol dehydrogenase-like predicted oxidoreductase